VGPSKLKLSGKGHTKLVLRGNGSECKPLGGGGGGESGSGADAGIAGGRRGGGRGGGGGESGRGGREVGEEEKGVGEGGGQGVDGVGGRGARVTGDVSGAPSGRHGASAQQRGELVLLGSGRAYTRSLQTSTSGPSGHIAHITAQLEHLRTTSTGYFGLYGGQSKLQLSGKGQVSSS